MRKRYHRRRPTEPRASHDVTPPARERRSRDETTRDARPVGWGDAGSRTLNRRCGSSRIDSNLGRHRHGRDVPLLRARVPRADLAVPAARVEQPRRRRELETANRLGVRAERSDRHAALRAGRRAERRAPEVARRAGVHGRVRHAHGGGARGRGARARPDVATASCWSRGRAGLGGDETRRAREPRRAWRSNCVTMLSSPPQNARTSPSANAQSSTGALHGKACFCRFSLASYNLSVESHDETSSRSDANANWTEEMPSAGSGLSEYSCA